MSYICYVFAACPNTLPLCCLFRLHVSVQEGVAVHRIETSFKKKPQSDGSIKVAVGDLFSDEQKDFLLELDIPGLYVADVTEPVMLVQARYLDISHTCMRDESFEATVARTADTAGLRQSHPLVLVSPSPLV